MIIGILGVLATLLIGGLGLYFKYFKGSSAQQVARTDHAMLQDAVDKPTNVNDAIDKL